MVAQQLPSSPAPQTLLTTAAALQEGPGALALDVMMAVVLLIFHPHLVYEGPGVGCRAMCCLLNEDGSEMGTLMFPHQRLVNGCPATKPIVFQKKIHHVRSLITALHLSP